MDTRTRTLTPLAAVTGGLLARVVGTAVMDAVLYARYRRSGGKDAPLEWEFPPTENWAEASAPGQVARRVIEGFTQRPIPDRWARLTTIGAHWAFGRPRPPPTAWWPGRCAPRPQDGLPFGAAVWALGYVVLPQAPVQADLGVRRRDAGQGPERPPRLRGEHRNRLLAGGHRSVTIVRLSVISYSSLTKSARHALFLKAAKELAADFIGDGTGAACGERGRWHARRRGWRGRGCRW